METGDGTGECLGRQVLYLPKDKANNGGTGNLNNKKLEIIGGKKSRALSGKEPAGDLCSKFSSGFRLVEMTGKEELMNRVEDYRNEL